MARQKKKYRMMRKDWGALLEGTNKVRANQAVYDRIAVTLGSWSPNDNRKLAIALTQKEVLAMFNAKTKRSGGFSYGYYLNTRQQYQGIARIYKAFGFKPPKEYLPHDALRYEKAEPGAVGFDSIPTIKSGTFVPHTKAA